MTCTIINYLLIHLNSNKIQIKQKNLSLTTILIFLFYFVFFQNVNCQVSPLSTVGPLYTERIQFLASGSNNASVDYSYNGWQFTSSISPLPNYYVLLSIQSLSIKVDSNFLTFYIANQSVYQTSIHLEIRYCQQSSGSCFTSVTIRVLAIDYDMPVDGSTYSQILQGLFVESVFLQTGIISQVHFPSRITNLTTFSYAIYLNGFRVKGSYLNYVVHQLTLFTDHFQINVAYQQIASSSSSSCQILFYSTSILQQNNRFNVSLIKVNYVSNMSQFTQNSNSLTAFYPSGQSLVFGLYTVQLATNNMQLKTIINSTRNFSSSSNFYLTPNQGWLRMQYFIISKLLCPATEKYYLTDINLCNSTFPSAYYAINVLNCFPCQNKRCLQCQANSINCTSCDTNTRTLTSVTSGNRGTNNLTKGTSGVTIDCLVNAGYYENNLTIAGSCVGNCSSCTDNNTCDTCNTNYYYSSTANKCQLCNDFFPNCATCSTLTPVTCSGCQNLYFLSAGQCISCERNCSVCSDNVSCTTCVTNYFYLSSANKCLICSDIFQNCINCSSSTIVNCQTCQNSYFVNNNGGCTACVSNCTSCQNASSCTTCLTSDFLYDSDKNSCLLCQDTFNNCVNCSNSSGSIQCQACNASFIKNISTNVSYNTACFSYCGDGILQELQECDDGNNLNFDGCDGLCQFQDNYNCTEDSNPDYPDYNISSCFYSGQILIIKTYLQKYPNENKVLFRFNLQPNLQIFSTLLFQQKMSNIISVLWQGYRTNTLKIFKVQNGLYKNGLFAITFSYQKQWKNVEISLDLANTNLSMFTANPSRRLLLQNYNQKNLRILQTSGTGQTPTSNFILPQNCDNNLVMYSDNYGMFSLTQYCSYFLVGIIWIYWLIGLFYGKMVVIDFMLVTQLLLLCSMTTGKLTPGFSGMMLQKFALYSFTGLMSIDYQARPIYQSLSPQLKSAYISSNSFQNLSLMIGIIIVITLVGLLSKLFSKIWKDKKYVCDLTFKYAFGEFLLYGFMPFMLIGNISTVLLMQNLISENGEFQIMNVLAVVAFNLLTVLMIVLNIVKTDIFGQFKTSFLRFDISQYHYVFVLIYITVIGYSFTLLYDTNISLYASSAPLCIFISIIVFNIYKGPYLQSRNQLRIYLLYGFGIIFTSLILVHNVIDINFLRQYLACIIIAGQSLLALITGYFLFKALNNEGRQKLSSFLQQINRQKMAYQIDSFNEKCTESDKKQILNKAFIDYYQKHSKILQNIKKNILPLTIDYQQQYKNLNNYIENNLNLEQIQQQKYVNLNESQKKKTNNLIQNSKLLKMSLKCYLINENNQNYNSNSQAFESYNQSLFPRKFSQQKYYDSQNRIKKIGSNQIINQEIKDKQNNIGIIENPRIDLIQNEKQHQQFPEQLITNYKVSDLFKKQKIKSPNKNKVKETPKYIKSQKTHKDILLEQLLSTPIQKVKEMSYDQLVKSLQENQKLQKK